MGRDLEKTAPVDVEPTRWDKSRVVVAFWLLGMCNNYIYVIMLSAAHDVISKVAPQDADDLMNATTPATPSGRHCNELSTGAVLLADIIPTLAVKLICPFLPFVIHFRVGFAVATGIVALILVGVAKSIILALVGVGFASFNSGLGEITLLAYSTLFPLYAVAGWSSGTGGAGLVGSFAYAGMTEGGLTPEMSLFVSIVIPVLFAISFWIILKHPLGKASSDSIIQSDSEVNSSKTVSSNQNLSNWKRMKDKLISDALYIPKLLPYMIPVGLVYYFEYLINSGLFELLAFDNTTLNQSSQFRWYNVMYQIGVFVSRSSVTWIHIEKVWILAVLQAANLMLLSADAIFGFIPNVWIMFIVIFWEGLLGGAAYVNTFYNMSYQIPQEKRLFALSIASVADTFGIVFAGITSFPVHDAICKLPYEPLFRWP